VQGAEGLKAGERVVTQATFLIDAESNIRAALAGFGAGEAK
jgi:Cu(I)/Ag(I) efflux system membrane fusion protein